MNGTRITGYFRSLPGYAAAFLLGFPILLLLRWVETRWGTSLLTSSLIEEGMKGCLFLALTLLLRMGRGRLAGVKEPELLALICIIGFAAAENSLYFFYAPTTAIYQRLTYSYPIHLNTGLLYTWIFLSLRQRDGTEQRIFPRGLMVCLGACIGTAYHFFLNVLALTAANATVYLVSGVNIVTLVLLFIMLHRKRIQRSLTHAGL